MLYLKAAGENAERGLAFIGPFGKRVSFASQQRRALNTVWALESAKVVGDGKKVAVIGAGLAGLTTAVALRARKCSVWVYEREPAPLERQSRAKHRYVHPTINFWPEIPIQPTTEFPFFDWYADICSNVISRLHTQWKDLTDEMSQIYYSTEVVGLSRTDHGKWLVRSNGKTVADETFDAVLVATGFGSEESIDGTDQNDYWIDDHLYADSRRTRNLLISGSGDGGLIDSLRAIHKEFENGRLCIKMAKALDETGVRQNIKDFEESAGQFSGTSDQLAIEYNKFYNEAVLRTPASCKKVLNISCADSAPITLCGRLIFPYSKGSAPIHKYMVAHAIARGKITYVHGQLHSGPTFAPLSGQDIDVTNKQIIVRHGPTTTLHKFVDAAVLDQLQLDQSKLGDLLDSPTLPVDHWQFGSQPAHDPTNYSFVRHRRSLAQQYVAQQYDGVLEINTRMLPQLSYKITIPRPPSRDEMKNPPMLFGIPTTFVQEQILDDIAGEF